MMSSLLSAELAATCNALGYFDTKANKYYADSNTLETAKDLVRYLRKDDESYDIRRQLGETKVLQADILPLLKNYWEDTDLFDVLLRLLVNLTTPALMLWNEEVPVEKTVRNHYLQVEDHLQCYKQAFADEAVWAVLSKRISKILEIEFSERGDDNSLIIERILILIRNVLYVPSDPDTERRPDSDASIHDQVLWALHQSAMLDIILYISSSITEQAYYMHILEILSFMLREQSASELANAALQRSQTEKLRDQAELKAIRQRESVQKQQKSRIFSGTRHSRFGGTYVVTTMKSISDNELIYHKPLSKLDDLNFDTDKQKQKTPKNRTPIQNVSSERRSAFSIRLFLKEFCIDFVKGAYNTLMNQTKRTLVRQRAQAHDESYYLWALRFFMEFTRCHKFEVKLVSETMTVETFHYVQQQTEKYFDMIQTDKKKLRLWSRRLHLALLAYRELVFTIAAMDKSSDESVRQSSKVIKSNIFYVLEYRELILTLLLTYDELKMSDAYLNDLIETQHVFLKMLQEHCTSGQIVVQSRSKGRRRQQGKRKKIEERTAESGTSRLDVNAQWVEASPQLSSILEGHAEIPTDVVPFDATSEVLIDEQKSESMKNIQRKLRNNEFENAIGLLRASREVWPENDCFGSNNMTPEEELLALQDIFFADLGVVLEIQNTETANGNGDEEIADEEDEEEGEGESMQISESDFKFEDFTKRLAHPKIIRACGLALKRFDKNSVLTNHCIVKLLHRIAWDSKMFAMIFQASIFRTFQKIYELKDVVTYRELVKFANFVVREFIKVTRTNSRAYIEVLFWKNSKEAYDVEQGYGSYQEKSEAAAKAWTELEEDELKALFMEHREKEIDEDVVDWIVGNLIDNTRSRRAVLKKLKEMYLLMDYKGPRKSGISGRPSKQWSEDEEVQLAELFEQFKDAMDPLGCIMDRLDVKRPKNRIVEKLLEMGLVQDRKELRKKRTGMSRNAGGSGKASKDNNLSDSDLNHGSTSDSDDGTVQNSASGVVGAAPAARRASKKRSQKPKGKSSNHVCVPYSEVAKLIAEVANSGMSEALEWLRENFADVAEDLENDPDDVDESGVPLVAILDCSVAAMENELFLRLLRGFGVREPADEQEMYWRIPGLLTSNIYTFLKGNQNVENMSENLDADNDSNTTLPKQSKISVIDSNFEDEAGPSQVRTSKRIKIVDSDSDDNIEEENNINLVDPDEETSISGRKTRFLDSDDESTEQQGTVQGYVTSDFAGTSSKKVNRILNSDDEDTNENDKKSIEGASDFDRVVTKKNRILDSDDEDVATDMAQESSTGKRLRSSDSDDAPTKKRTRVLDSDEDY